VASLADVIDAAPHTGQVDDRPDTRHRPMSVSGLSADDLDALKSSWPKARPS
jgi:mycobactin peptide synthetase MbtE